VQADLFPEQGLIRNVEVSVRMTGAFVGGIVGTDFHSGLVVAIHMRD
jgi:hypothetical protein